MNRQKIIKFQLFPFLITILLFSSFMAPSALENEQQTLRKTAILNQSENSSYGLLQGNHLMEKQIISTDYPSSVRYTHPSVSLTKTLGNNESQEYHSSSSSPYSEFRYYDSYEDKRTTLPSHVIAKNLTDNIPTLNLTTYIEFMGLLDLDDRTIVFAKKDVLYAYTIILPEGNYYDLNIRTTEDTNFYITQDKVFVNSFIVDGKTRSLQRLFPYKGMNLTLYFYSASESYIIFEPINLKPKELALNQPYFEYYYNEADQLWNETTQSFEKNWNKYNTHAFYMNIPKGAYVIEFEPLDKTNIADCYLDHPVIIEQVNFAPAYFQYMLGTSGSFYKTYFEFFENTTIYFLVIGQEGKGFDYILNVKDLNGPELKEGEVLEIDDTKIYFEFNLDKTAVCYFNSSHNINNNLFYYSNGNHKYISLVMSTSGTFLLLQPGKYYFTSFTAVTVKANYTVTLFEPTVFDYQTTSSYDFQLNQINQELPTGAILLEMNMEPYTFTNFNITFKTQNNYTVPLAFYHFEGISPFQFSTTSTVFGNQESNEEFQSYISNNTEMANYYSTPSRTKKYLMILVGFIYNNTLYSEPNYGDLITNKTMLDFSLIFTGNDAPLVLKENNVGVYDANVTMVDNKGLYNTNLYEHEYDRLLYVLDVETELYNWISVDILLTNFSLSSSAYLPVGFDSSSTAHITRAAVIYDLLYYGWSSLYYRNLDDSNSSNVILQFEFPAYSSQFKIRLLLYSLAGFNGTMSVSITSHICSILEPIIIGDVFVDVETIDEPFFTKEFLIKAGIIGGAALGAIAIITTIVILIKKKK